MFHWKEHEDGSVKMLLLVNDDTTDIVASIWEGDGIWHVSANGHKCFSVDRAKQVAEALVYGS